jgi:hypothetical protein
VKINLKGFDYMEDLDVDGKIVLKLVEEKEDGGVDCVSVSQDWNSVTMVA